MEDNLLGGFLDQHQIWP